MREATLAGIRDAENVLALYSALQRAAAELEFPYFTFGLRIATEQGTENFSLSNFPAAWRQEYDRRDCMQIDPVVQASLLSLSSVFWDDLKLRRRVEREFMTEAARHGLAHGITMPIYGQSGEIGLLSLSREEAIPRAISVREQLRIYGTTLAWSTYETSMAILQGDSSQPSLLHLTEQELACLKDASLGRIADGEPDNSARQAYLLMSAVRKLGASSRDEALAAANVLGLLHLPEDTPPIQVPRRLH